MQKVLAKNIRNQVRQEREAINLASTETGTVEQETKRINQKLQQMTKNVEFHKVQLQLLMRAYLGINLSKRKVWFLQKKLEEQNLDLERLNRLYEEEEKFVAVMEKMVESQTEDHSILDKYSHQDNLTIKVINNNPHTIMDLY